MVPEVFDGTTKGNDFFHQKKQKKVSSNFLPKNWHGVPTKLLRMFREKTAIFCLGL